MLISVQNLLGFWGKQRLKVSTLDCIKSDILSEHPAVLKMDIIAEVRRRHLVSGESISSIARSLIISRPTVRKHFSTIS